MSNNLKWIFGEEPTVLVQRCGVGRGARRRVEICDVEKKDRTLLNDPRVKHGGPKESLC